MTDAQDLDNPPPPRRDDARAMVRDYAAQLRRRDALLPGLLMAGSAFWLAASLTRDTRIARQLHLDDGLDQLRATTSKVRARVEETVDHLKERSEEMQAAAAEGLSGWRARTAEVAGTLQARTKRAYDASFETEPLVIAAIGVAVGAGLAVLWPATASERRLFGETAARLAERAKVGLSEVGAVAERAMAQAKAEVHRQTDPDSGAAGLADTAEATLHAGAQAVTEAVGDAQRPTPSEAAG